MYKRNNVIYIKVNNLFTYDVDLKNGSKEFWLSHLRDKTGGRYIKKFYLIN